MKTNYKLYLVLILCIFIFSCSNGQYTITKDFIESKAPFDSFIFNELIVDSCCTKEKVPIKYSIERAYMCTHRKSYINQETGQSYYADSAIVNEKKIYFNKRNRYYSWWSYKPYDPAMQYETLPLEFKNEKWYLITALKHPASQSFKIFIFVDVEGTRHYYQVLDLHSL